MSTDFLGTNFQTLVQALINSRDTNTTTTTKYSREKYSYFCKKLLNFQ